VRFVSMRGAIVPSAEINLQSLGFCQDIRVKVRKRQTRPANEWAAGRRWTRFSYFALQNMPCRKKRSFVDHPRRSFPLTLGWKTYGL